VLRILRGAGSEGIPTLSIPERMIEQTPGITRLLDRLEERGLAERRRCTEDRRRVYCVITEDGKRLLGELDPVTDQADETAMSGIADEQLDEFLVTLSRVRAGVHEGLE
jgi:DNA-binding MarR family transcriptional regulator